MKQFICDHCGTTATRHSGHVNRSRKHGHKIFCSKKCSDEGRKKYIPIQVKKERKRLYDIEYRRKNAEKIKAKNVAWFQRDYSTNPDKYKSIRRAKMKSHIEYCRQPSYKEKKHRYDRSRYAKGTFGPLWEIHVLAMDITEAAQEKMTKFEMMHSKGTINKAQGRKRKWKSLTQSI